MILIAKRTDGGVSITRLPEDEKSHEDVIFNATHHVPFDENGKAMRNENGTFVWIQRPEYVSWRIGQDSELPSDRNSRDLWRDEDGKIVIRNK